MESSDGIDKSWDHPWTTEEMRKKRREWSLAGDVGLLKHLQQFSENLMSRTNKTQAALDTLTTQLKETEILVDNVTNTSLALANTQFIESRVQEDDIEIKENSEKQEIKTQDLVPENLLASISESVKQGLNIMDEKYKVMDVACSDSEEEDEGGVVFSVIVEPNDPYQDRPLPYVIGSDKWVTSNKIGLESSSSESEQADEEREESESEKEDASMQKMFNNRHNPDINIARLSSSSSDSDNYIDSNNTPYMNNKADIISQNNINSASESVTPNNVSKTSNETESNFAEELAKRLGTVRQAQNPIVVDEVSESSINRFKSDLFASEKDENVFNDSSDNLFNDKKDLFNDQVSADLWKKKSYKSNNIIPPSIDIPPPINIVSTKPKSAIDDLFADADSDDDLDIFSSRNIIKKHAKEPTIDGNNRLPAKGFLNVMKTTGNIATSTPESNVNASGLFNDDENDDANLFGSPKKESHKAAPSSTNTIQESNKKEPILGNILPSNVENKLSSQIMQRRQKSSGSSSDSDAPENCDDVTKSNAELASAERDTSNNSTAITDRRLQITPAENSAENVLAIGNNSSGVDMRPSSIDNTVGSSLWMNFQPEMTSTRLKSEEMYCEGVNSDSLFTAQTRYFANPANTNSNSNNQQQQQQSRQEQRDSSSLLQDDVFENDEDNLFGPPPLPTKSDSKRAPKSKISLLFDDSDSGDELFSAASSGSRSQKSTDFLATVSSSDRTTKALPKSSGLFDDDNIFSRKDAPDIDIFDVVSKSRNTSNDLFDSRGREQYSVTSKSNNIDNLQDTKMESKKISLFDDDDGDLFTSVKSTKSKSDRKTDVLFEDEDDLFLSNKASNKRHSSVEEGTSVEPKTDVSKNTSSLETEKKNKDSSSDYMDGLFSKATKTHSLLFETDDYDDLFGKKDAVPREDDRSKSESKEEVRKDTIEKVQELSEQNKDSESSSLNRDIKVTTEIKSVIAKSDINEEKNKDEVGETVSKAKEDGRLKKNSPPKTLSIRTTSSPPSEEQNGQQVPRKSVSGKIKNLMGKMGDLKILSPMDAPPLWRKSEDKTDDDEDIVDKDNGDQSISGCISPPSVSEGSVYKEFSYSTTISTTSNVEVAINFDDLAQVETLSTTASKSRVRIQAKRRPQSRHARKSALRHSGIDFDTVDNADNDNSLDESHTNTFSSTKDLSAAPSTADRLTANNVQRSTVDPLSTDDKSELGSISKESSMSVNKNTLLSPSTDEEDLFDVPPDLPEDPQREDTLFGRAPILSPIDDGQSDRTPVAVKPLIDTVIRRIDDVDIDTNNTVNNKSLKRDSSELTQSDIDTKSDTLKDAKKKDDKRSVNEERNETTREFSKEPSDPLRDSSHDPLKDPSQLFAFVTKTPSPEKNKGLLFSESDDSLFSSSSVNKLSESKKKVLDLFADDDAGGDLFSAAPLKKTVKKPLQDTKIGLFGDDDDVHNEDDNLFGSASGKTKQESQKSNFVQAGRKKNNIFDDDDEDSSLFVESSGQSQKSDSTSFSESKHDLADSQAKNSNLKDIFGDMAYNTFPGSGKIDNDDNDIDLFATRKVVPKKVKSLFASDDENDDDGDHIFSKQSSVSIHSKTNTTTSSKSVMKKSVTRDLKKTAEKIVEDPLSLLQDD